MMSINIYRKMNVKNPTLLAAWPGMGNVGLRAIDYLRKKLETTLFAEIDVSEFVIPDMVVVKDGITEMPRAPKNLFYCQRDLGLIIFEAENQLKDKHSITLVNDILDFAQRYNVKRIFTGAAFPLPISYEEPSKVYVVANKKSLSNILFSKYGLKIMESGQISGLNGLLPGLAKQREIEAACLLATMPLYAMNIPYPKASKSLVEVFARILNVRVNTEELNQSIQNMEMEMEKLEESVKGQISAAKEEDFPDASKEEEIPGYVRKKIERLFREAKLDKKKAYILKEELDKWNLFELYEDRFLDLFEKGEAQA